LDTYGGLRRKDECFSIMGWTGRMLEVRLAVVVRCDAKLCC
jgi:hypothetical protein